MIENLIDKALKCMKQGSVSVSLYLSKAERKVIFAVKDTGVGIAKETLPKLFQKSSPKQSAKGGCYGANPRRGRSPPHQKKEGSVINVTGSQR